MRTCVKTLPISGIEIGGPVGGLIQLINFQYQSLEQTRVKSMVETRVETSGTTQEKVLRLIREAPAVTRRELDSTIGMNEDEKKHHLGKLKKSSPEGSPESSPEGSPESSLKMLENNRQADIREREAGNA